MTSPDLSVRIGALSLKNPVLVASGTFGYGAEYAGLIDLSRLGGIVTKTLTSEPWPGNPPPRAVETAAGMLNSIGLQNVGVQAFIRDKLPFLRTVDTALIVNVGGESPEDFARVVESLADCEGIDAFEINMSCPNVAGGLDFSTDPGRAADLVTRLRRLTSLPLIPKLTPNVTDIAGIAASVEEAGADAVSAINTLRGMAVDIKTRRPGLGTVTGGLSGPAIKPVAVAAVWRIACRVKIPVIGIGGVMSAGDALEFLLAGATAIQVGTANFVEPRTGADIAAGLRDYCDEAGIPSIREATGSLLPPEREHPACRPS